MLSAVRLSCPFNSVKEPGTDLHVLLPMWEKPLNDEVESSKVIVRIWLEIVVRNEKPGFRFLRSTKAMFREVCDANGEWNFSDNVRNSVWHGHKALVIESVWRSRRHIPLSLHVTDTFVCEFGAQIVRIAHRIRFLESQMRRFSALQSFELKVASNVSRRRKIRKSDPSINNIRRSCTWMMSTTLSM